MTAASTAAPPLHVLRGILRLLRTPKLSAELARKQQLQQEHCNSASKLNVCQKYVLQQYRLAATSDTGSSSSSSTNASRQRQYWQLQQNLSERARLYALDTGAEEVLTPHEMSRRAAARAGLQLPKVVEHEDRS